MLCDYLTPLMSWILQAQAGMSDGVSLDVLGGGRVEHYPAQDGDGVVYIYGYSSAFGAAPHEITAALVQKWLPLSTVAFDYSGY